MLQGWQASRNTDKEQRTKRNYKRRRNSERTKNLIETSEESRPVAIVQTKRHRTMSWKFTKIKKEKKRKRKKDEMKVERRKQNKSFITSICPSLGQRDARSKRQKYKGPTRYRLRRVTWILNYHLISSIIRYRNLVHREKFSTP